MLELNGLSLSFTRYRSWFRQEEITRLSGLSFSLARGEVLAVIGSSGAGKSLLAHALLGLLPPNARLSGTARFEGQSLSAPYPSGLRGRRIALMPQDIGHLDPLAPIGQQLTWALRRAEGSGCAQARLSALGLPPEVSKLYPHQLSGGMARRVLFAIATAGRPSLLIADEPTAGLDPQSRDLLLACLHAHAQSGGGVLMITHDLVAALPIADRVAILDQGQLCGLEAARDFSAEGENLRLPLAKALWRALPQNGLHHA